MTRELEFWAKGSAFVDEQGKLERWYHGTDYEDGFNIFARYEDSSIGFHFGTAEAANDRLNQIDCLEDNGNILAVYCRAQRPLVLDDMYTWDQWDVAQALRMVGVLTEDEAELVADSINAEMIYASIEEAGYDSVLYRNECENKQGQQLSLMVWRANLIKGINSASFDKDDPRILSQLPVGESELAWYTSNERSIDACREELRAYRNAAHTLMPC
jgi:hypothetical protein